MVFEGLLFGEKIKIDKNSGHKLSDLGYRKSGNIRKISKAHGIIT